MARRFLHAVSITLTTAATRYSVLTLARAIDSTCPQKVKNLQLNNDATNAGIVYVGDELVSATRRLASLSNGESYFTPGTANSIDTSDFYLTSDTNATVVNVGFIEEG